MQRRAFGTLVLIIGWFSVGTLGTLGTEGMLRMAFMYQFQLADSASFGAIYSKN